MKRLIMLFSLLVFISGMSYADTTQVVKKRHTPVAAHKQLHKKHKKSRSRTKKHGVKHTTQSKNKKKSNHSARRHVSTSKYKPQYAPATNIESVIPSAATFSTRSRRGFVSSIEQKLVQFVHKTVSTIQYSAYQLGGKRFDASKGIYVLDCSDYVDNILHAVYPKAYSSLVNSTGTDKPTSQHYYDFFNQLSDNSSYYWNKIDDVDQLQAGDILVFRNKKGLRNGAGGHVMIVMDKPVEDDDAFLVQVADSAPVGHSHDTRQANSSGIGVGTLVLKVDRSGSPSAYAWKIGSRWRNNVFIAMARPVGTYN
jgi:hypothetical protein